MSEAEPIRRRLTLSQARESPCTTCATTPCCTHLPLHTFHVRTLRDLDHALYLLNFDRIQLGLAPSGEWSVYYRYPCRLLDRDRGLCTVHGTPQQPQICVHYNPYSCWYRRALTAEVSEEFLRIDRRRLEVIAERILFDEHRNIVEVPNWSELLPLLERVPMEPECDRAPEEDPVFERWLHESAQGPPLPVAVGVYSYDQFLDPCSGCQAYCCTTLVFPYSRPATRRNLDYLQFALGFPGVEVGISDQDWQIVVKTRCRHLTEDWRCGVYGRPERPMICKYYDATSCTYVAQFGTARPRGLLRVRLEQFLWMAETVGFDGDGNIVSLPPVERMRRHIEERWRAALAAAAAG